MATRSVSWVIPLDRVAALTAVTSVLSRVIGNLSLIIIAAGLTVLGIESANGELPLSIDFTGGSLLEIKFASAQPQPAEIVSLYDELGVKDVSVQTTGEGTYNIRSSALASRAMGMSMLK